MWFSLAVPTNADKQAAAVRERLFVTIQQWKTRAVRVASQMTDDAHHFKTKLENENEGKDGREGSKWPTTLFSS